MAIIRSYWCYICNTMRAFKMVDEKDITLHSSLKQSDVGKFRCVVCGHVKR